MSEWRLQSDYKPEYASWKKKLIVGSVGGAALALTAGLSVNKLTHQKSDEKRTPRTPELLTLIAHSFDVPLNKPHVTYWETIAATYRAIDDIVDEDRAQAESLDQKALALICGQPIPGVTEAEAKNFSDIIHTASEDRREAIMSGLEITTFAEKLRTTTDVNEMIAVRREESALLSRIMSLENPKHDPTIYAFNAWMVQAGESAYHTDTVRDLHSDYASGITSVAPTPVNYFIASKEALRSTFSSLSKIPLRAIVPVFAASLKWAGRALVGK